MEALRSWKEEILNIREEGRAGVKINQAEELAGITRKNIRFYEEHGLIKPGRNPENSYREYSLRDVEQLKRIKLMRMLGVPCGKIREVESGGLSLKQCMDDQIMELQNSIRTSERMQEICAAVSSEKEPFSEMDPSEYLEKIRKMEEGGVSFVNVQRTDISRRKTGAALAAAAAIIFFAGMIALVLWANHEAPVPPLVLTLIIVFPAAVIVGVVIALRQRIKELKGGEYDDARKY